MVGKYSCLVGLTLLLVGVNFIVQHLCTYLDALFFYAFLNMGVFMSSLGHNDLDLMSVFFWQTYKIFFLLVLKFLPKFQLDNIFSLTVGNELFSFPQNLVYHLAHLEVGNTDIETAYFIFIYAEKAFSVSL